MSRQPLHLLPFNQVTFSERERAAYASGHADIADLFYEASMFESQVELFDSELDSERVTAFEAGKNEGMGIDTAERIEELETDLNNAQDKNRRIVQVQRKMIDLFNDPRMKTVAGRKQLKQIMNSSLIY